MKFDRNGNRVSRFGAVKIVCEQMPNSDKWQVGVFVEKPTKMPFYLSCDMSEEDAKKMANAFEQVSSRSAFWAASYSDAEDARCELLTLLGTRLQ